jgi:hypothetical protein
LKEQWDKDDVGSGISLCGEFIVVADSVACKDLQEGEQTL